MHRRACQLCCCCWTNINLILLGGSLLIPLSSPVGLQNGPYSRARTIVLHEQSFRTETHARLWLQESLPIWMKKSCPRMQSDKTPNDSFKHPAHVPFLELYLLLDIANSLYTLCFADHNMPYPLRMLYHILVCHYLKKIVRPVLIWLPCQSHKILLICLVPL